MSITVRPYRYTSKDPWTWGARIQIEDKKFETGLDHATPQEAAEEARQKALDYFTTAIQTVRDSPVLVNAPIEVFEALTSLQSTKK